MLAAFIVGFEVCSRLSRANPTHNGAGSWHGTSTIGAISAAVACARLLKVPAAAIPDVIGIAVSMASGVNANYGTMTKPLHAGHAARNGMAAALLGKAGLSANHAALEGRGGFFATFARGIPWSAEPFDDLGRTYDLAEVGFRPKRYPCGGVIHTGIDAALQIRDELGAKVADITAIKAGISKYAASRAGAEYPANMEAAKFNLQYVVAASLANGVPKLATFEPEAIKDERVKALAKMVSVALDPEFADAIEDYPTRVIGHAEGRPHGRAHGGLCQRHREKPDVGGADAREVLRLLSPRRGGAAGGGKDRGGARPTGRSAVVRRVLAADPARLTFTLCQG